MAYGLSLHVGVGSVDEQHYLGWSGQAPSCEHDASNMAALAKSCGFFPTLLLTRDATADRVLDEIRKAAGRLNGGDILLISYSGHGTTVPDINGDEPSGQDDVWALYNRMLIDDELYSLWSEFHLGVRVVVVVDSCTDGTIISVPLSLQQISHRQKQLHARAMPREVTNLVYKAHQTFYDDIQMKTTRHPPQSTVLLLSSSQDGEPSFDDGSNGLFTRALTNVWQNGKFEGHYCNMYVEISNRTRTLQNPNFYLIGPTDPVFPCQKPFKI
ncbi:MAG: caspase family protein [Acidobacteriia bacterium]|nr:caspase family protein [Terriglobia bacterium]